MIRIAIAEDHQALLDGIKLMLEFETDIEVVGEANDGEELLEIVKSKQPDLVLTDIRMPKCDGLCATKAIMALYPNTRIIGFSMFEQYEAVQQMKAAGAKGYILKNSSLKKVLEAIRTVASGKTYFDNDIITWRSSRTCYCLRSSSSTSRSRSVPFIHNFNTTVSSCSNIW